MCICVVYTQKSFTWLPCLNNAWHLCLNNMNPWNNRFHTDLKQTHETYKFVMNLGLPFRNPWWNDSTPWSWSIGLWQHLVISFPLEFFCPEVGSYPTSFFWPFFGPLVIYATLLVFTFVVSCEACGILVFFTWNHLPCTLQPSSFLDKLWRLIPLQNGVVNPSLQAIKGNHLLCILIFHGSGLIRMQGLDILPHYSKSIGLAQA
jgi:hypothetical protein